MECSSKRFSIPPDPGKLAWWEHRMWIFRSTGISSEGVLLPTMNPIITNKVVFQLTDHEAKISKSVKLLRRTELLLL